MPLDLTFFPQWNFVHVDYFGRTTVGDIVRSYSDILAHPEADSLRYSLNDMRGLNALNVFYEGMSLMASTISSDAAERRVPWEIAIVNDKRGIMPILTDYCAQISQGGKARCGLFHDVAGAVDWLGAPSEVMDLSLPCGRRISDPPMRASQAHNIAGTT